jgi:hypothetical protein
MKARISKRKRKQQDKAAGHRDRQARQTSKGNDNREGEVDNHSINRGAIGIDEQQEQSSRRGAAGSSKR